MPSPDIERVVARYLLTPGAIDTTEESLKKVLQETAAKPNSLDEVLDISRALDKIKALKRRRGDE